MLKQFVLVVITALCRSLVEGFVLRYHSQKNVGWMTTSRNNNVPVSLLQVATESTNNDVDILDNPMFVDEKKELAKFDLKGRTPEDLITIAKQFLAYSNGIGCHPNMLAEDFVFEGPVVGPLVKKEFLDSIGQVHFAKAFPKWKGEFYGFHVDPFEGNRVWYTARGQGTNSGPLPPFALSPTGRQVINPPQVCSITIDVDSGLVKRYTIGYVVDRTVGNTGGLGGLYGILYAIGTPLPFPEAQPWQKSWQYATFQKISGFLGNLRRSGE